MIYEHEQIREIQSTIVGQAETTRRVKLQKILEQTISTRIRTSFVFPIAEFERVFGYLWGHEVQDKTLLTQDQILFWGMYKEIRKSIFDNGNAQIRAIVNELNCLI